MLAALTPQSYMSSKTPISLLQEVCVKRGITPTYELLANEGPIHDPLFVFQCSAGEWIATAKGLSKKKAKHHAAYMVLMKMVNGGATTEPENAVLRELQLDTAIEQMAGLAYDDNNPVGELQELCQRSAWPSPSYEFMVSTQMNQSKIYTCLIKLWTWTTQSSGKSKKLAKRRAALDMLQKIKDQNLSIPQEALEMMEEEHLPMVRKGDQQAMIEQRAPTLSEKTTRNVNRASKGLWSKRGKKIPVIDVDLSQPELDPIQTLEDLGKNYSFSAFYSYITQTKSGQVHALVQLNTHPSHVVLGSGKSLVEARLNAAFQTLVFLKMVTPVEASWPSDFAPRIFSPDVWERAAGMREEPPDEEE